MTNASPCKLCERVGVGQTTPQSVVTPSHNLKRRPERGEKPPDISAGASPTAAGNLKRKGLRGPPADISAGASPTAAGNLKRKGLPGRRVQTLCGSVADRSRQPQTQRPTGTTREDTQRERHRPRPATSNAKAHERRRRDGTATPPKTGQTRQDKQHEHPRKIDRKIFRGVRTHSN